MADSIIPKNGAVAVAGFVADFSSMRPRTSQSVEDVTPYGANTMGKNRGSGTPIMDIDVGGFMLKHAASTAPPFVVMSSPGVDCTFTFDTSCTLSGNCVMSEFDLQHARMRAAVPFTLRMRNADDLTQVWAINVGS